MTPNEYEGCIDLKDPRGERGSTDHLSNAFDFEKKMDAAIEARCGKPGKTQTAVKPTDIDPSDR